MSKVERFPCWSCKESVSMRQRANADGDCPHCGAELDLEDWPIREPAAELLQAQATIAHQAQMIEHLRGGLMTPTSIDVANADADGYRNGFAAAIKSLPEQQYFTNWAAYTEWRAAQIEAVGDFGGEVQS